MKTIKRIIIIEIFLAFVLVLFACTRKTDDSSQTLPPDNPPITEPAEDVKNYEDGTTTILIYMCGSNLESKKGAATKNIAEMLTTKLPENVRVIIQTGGAKAWRNYNIPFNMSCRYEIKNQSLTLLEENGIVNMGLSSTLSDFIIWGADTAPAEKIAVILWDHGGGSLGGVCLDEQFNLDALTLPELKNAFAMAQTKLNRKLEWVGFDACLMATLDTANIISNYAKYMIASEEIEPTGGWNYADIISNLASEPNLSTIDLGKQICNSYKKKCELNGKGNFITLSFIDLSKIPSVITAFEAFTKEVLDGLSGYSGLRYLFDSLNYATNFGGNSNVERYSNLLDITNVADRLVFSYENAADLFSALNNSILYSVCGESRKDACGLSFFYPEKHDKSELNKYLSICEFNNYKAFLNKVYFEKPDSTIEFVDKGSVAQDGSFQISLSENSTNFIESVNFYLLEFLSEEESACYGLGEDNDILSFKDKTQYNSNFRGIWLAINGEKLSYRPIDRTDGNIIFTAPILLNGNQTNLRFAFIFDDRYENGGYYVILGTWDGIDDNGFADRDLRPLVKGDKVTVLYNKIGMGDYASSLVEGNTITIDENGGVITEEPLKQQYYQYVYKITDIYGNVFYSSTATFKMKYTYEELLIHPLPDGEYAAEVYNISDGDDNDLIYGK